MINMTNDNKDYRFDLWKEDNFIVRKLIIIVVKAGLVSL